MHCEYKLRLLIIYLLGYWVALQLRLYWWSAWPANRAETADPQRQLAPCVRDAPRIWRARRWPESHSIWWHSPSQRARCRRSYPVPRCADRRLAYTTMRPWRAHCPRWSDCGEEAEVSCIAIIVYPHLLTALAYPRVSWYDRSSARGPIVWPQTMSLPRTFDSLACMQIDNQIYISKQIWIVRSATTSNCRAIHHFIRDLGSERFPCAGSSKRLHFSITTWLDLFKHISFTSSKLPSMWRLD